MNDKNQNRLCLGIAILFLIVHFNYLGGLGNVEAAKLTNRIETRTFKDRGCLFLLVEIDSYSNSIQVKHHPVCKNPDHR
jgi:hypothetical protein